MKTLAVGLLLALCDTGEGCNGYRQTEYRCDNRAIQNWTTECVASRQPSSSHADEAMPTDCYWTAHSLFCDTLECFPDEKGVPRMRSHGGKVWRFVDGQWEQAP